MALAATDWVSPMSATMAPANAKEMITALYNLINGSSTSYATITDYSATEAHLELSFSGQTDMRVLIFGGQTPNTNAVYSGLSLDADSVYILCTPDAGTTGPDQSYTVGNPYNTSGGVNTDGVTLAGYVSTVDLVRFFECSDGCGVYFSRSGTGSFMGGFAGGLLQSPDKNTLRYLASGSGSTYLSSSWASSTTGASAIQVEASPSSGDPVCSCLVSGYSAPFDAYRSERILSGGNFKDTDGRGVIQPVILASDTGNVSPGTIRGIYMGPTATYGNTVNGTDGWAMAGTTATDALYFANL